MKIEKTVAGHASDTDFTFTVNIYSDKSKTTEFTDRKYNYTKTTSSGTETGTITSGGTIKLKGGENIVIEKLPEGAYYTVVETAQTGYKTSVKKDAESSTYSEGSSSDGTIVNKETQYAGFMNIYSANGSDTFTGTKTLTGRKMTADDVFEFTLKAGDTDLGKVKVNVTEGASSVEIAYPDVYFVVDTETTATGWSKVADDAGYTTQIIYTVKDAAELEASYSFTIAEENKEAAGITYAATAVTADVPVTVTDNGDGTITVEIDESKIVYKDSTGATISGGNFTNTYEATGNITFKGTKSIDMRDLTENDVFTFTVMEGNKLVAEVENDKDGKISYPTIEYVLNDETDDTGIHTYTIKETSEDGNGITVSTKEYTVTVNVTDDKKGNLTAEITSSDKSFDFINTYEAKGSIV